MRAELIVDLHNVGTEVGRALGQEYEVLPALGNIAALWKCLGVEVEAMRVVAPIGDAFSGRLTNAWWTTEQALLDDQDFAVELLGCPQGSDGAIAVHEMMVTTALSRSDELASAPQEADDVVVIVMSSAPSMAVTVTHARGVPVMIAAPTIHDSRLAHTRLDLAWMGVLKDRFAAVSLKGIDVRDGRPWLGDAAISTPYNSTQGRDERATALPSFAESIALLDPEFFQITSASGAGSPREVGLAAVVHALGLGALVHVEDVSNYGAGHPEAAANLYRFAADNPDAPIVIASTRPAMIALTSDLEGYRVPNPQRVLRLCLPEREAGFDEAEFATSSSAARMVLERTLTEPLFPEGEEEDLGNSERHLHLVSDGEIEDPELQQTSPTLRLYANPNTIREDSGRWRTTNKRRFLLLGATGAEATPADMGDGTFLPISLGGCTDFEIRRPALRPGCVVEGVLHPDGDRWLVVSDPIERRRHRRTAQPEAA